MSKKIYYYLKEIEESIKGVPIMPVTCEIDLSNKCQLNCSFCMYEHYRKNNRVFLDWVVYIQLIKSLAAAGAKSVTFTGGGESTMHPRFLEMVEIASMAGMKIGLITNGVLLHKIPDLTMFKFVRVSLDAATRETYKAIKGKDLFTRVVQNIKEAVDKKETVVGISFVVSAENKKEIKKAKKLAKGLGVNYIQFKPAWINGLVYDDYEVEKDSLALATERSVAKDRLPCDIAGLIGVVAATADVYFCCQHRGNPKYKLGSLVKNSFQSIWENRRKVCPDFSTCPMCRYMEYADEYKKLIGEGTMFFEHKEFL